MRNALITFFRLVLRVFFRRIEVVGSHHLPKSGPVLFAPNHQSGLIDPLFVLCLTGRRVSFLAKEPLFHTPFVGFFVRLFECLPVYRAADGADPKKNRAMMTEAVRLLGKGNALCIFPEGTSHSDPDLRPLRPGVARIALITASVSGEPVHIVPTVIYYEQKHMFRSRAVLAFAAPLAAEPTKLDDSGNPSRNETEALVRAVERAIESLLPTADSHAELLLAERAERILTAHLTGTQPARPEEEESSGAASVPLAERMRLRRRVMANYEHLRVTEPEVTRSIAERITTFATELERYGIPADAPLTPRRATFRRLLLPLGVLLPVFAAGIVVHYATHTAVRALAFRYAGTELDLVATGKLVGGLLLYPLTWIAWAVGLAFVFEQPLLVLAALAGPALGSATVFYEELLDDFVGKRTLWRALQRAPHRLSELYAVRTQLARELLELDERVRTRARQA